MDELLKDFTSFLSFKLGEYQGKGLYKNYPGNFNTLIPELARELLDEVQSYYAGLVGEKDKERKEKNSLDITESYFRGRQDGFTIKDTECQQRIEEIFAEIERISSPMNTNMYGISLSKGQWQSIKAKAVKSIAIREAKEKVK